MLGSEDAVTLRSSIKTFDAAASYSTERGNIATTNGTIVIKQRSGELHNRQDRCRTSAKMVQ